MVAGAHRSYGDVYDTFGTSTFEATNLKSLKQYNRRFCY